MNWELILILIYLIIGICCWSLIIEKRKKKQAKQWKEEQAELEYQIWKAKQEHIYEDYITRREVLFRARYEKERLGK